MKKFLSLVIAVVMMISAFAITASASWKYFDSASSDATDADNFGNSYTVKRTAEQIVLDGKVTDGEDWGSAANSAAFKMVYYSGNADDTTIDKTVPLSSRPTVTFKSMWYNDGTDSYLYILLDSSDSTLPIVNGATKYDHWASDSFHLVVDENNDGTDSAPANELQTAAMYLTGRSGLSETSYPGITRLTYAFDDRRANGGQGYGVEMIYKFKTAADCAGEVGFDIVSTDRIGETGDIYIRNSWNGINNTNKNGTGILNISSDMVKPVNENADVLYYNGTILTNSAMKDMSGKVTLPTSLGGRNVGAWKEVGGTKIYAPGAEVTVADNTKLSLEAVYSAPVTLDGAAACMDDSKKMRFDAEVGDLDKLGTSVKEVGFIFVKSELLTQTVIEAGITEDSLTAANIAFTKVAASAVVASFSGELTAEDTATEYSAVSYIKFEAEGGDAVVYSDYSEEKNSRCIEDICKAAYADRTQVKNGEYTYKIGKDHGVENFEIMSYSPYTPKQLGVLKTLGKIS